MQRWRNLHDQVAKIVKAKGSIDSAPALHNDKTDCEQLLRTLRDFLQIQSGAPDFYAKTLEKLEHFGALPTLHESHEFPIEVRIRELILAICIVKRRCLECQSSDGMDTAIECENILRTMQCASRTLHFATYACNRQRALTLSDVQKMTMMQELHLRKLESSTERDQIFVDCYDRFLNSAVSQHWRKTPFSDMCARHDTHVYSRHSLPLDNGKVIDDTRCYKRLDARGGCNTNSTIESHIHRMFCEASVNSEIFKTMTTSSMLRQNLAEKLKCCVDERFPELNPHRNLFCAKDGILATHWPLRPDDHKIASGEVHGVSFHKDFANGVGSYRNIVCFVDPRIETGFCTRCETFENRSAHLDSAPPQTLWNLHLSSSKARHKALTHVKLSVVHNERTINVNRSVMMPWLPGRYVIETLLEYVKNTILTEIACACLESRAAKDFVFQVYLEPGLDMSRTAQNKLAAALPHANGLDLQRWEVERAQVAGCLGRLALHKQTKAAVNEQRLWSPDTTQPALLVYEPPEDIMELWQKHATGATAPRSALLRDLTGAKRSRDDLRTRMEQLPERVTLHQFCAAFNLTVGEPCFAAPHDRSKIVRFSQPDKVYCPTAGESVVLLPLCEANRGKPSQIVLPDSTQHALGLTSPLLHFVQRSNSIFQQNRYLLNDGTTIWTELQSASSTAFDIAQIATDSERELLQENELRDRIEKRALDEYNRATCEHDVSILGSSCLDVPSGTSAWADGAWREPRVWHGRLRMRAENMAFSSYTPVEGLLSRYAGFKRACGRTSTLVADEPPLGAYERGHLPIKLRNFKNFRKVNLYCFERCIDTAATQRFFPHEPRAHDHQKSELPPELNCINLFHGRWTASPSVDAKPRDHKWIREACHDDNAYNYNVVGVLPFRDIVVDNELRCAEGEPEEMMIYCESSDVVFAYQLDKTNLSAARSYWGIYAALGRLLEFAGCDNDQQALLLVGLTQTGKSNIEKLVRMIYPADSVGTLSGNAEKTFGLSVHLEPMKKLLICPELGGQGPMNATEFKSVTSNEIVNAPVKNGKALNVAPLFHMLMTANSLPVTWKDDGGSLVRRILAFSMENRVTTIDEGLAARGTNAITQFIMKISRAFTRLRFAAGETSAHSNTEFVDLDNTQMLGGLYGAHFDYSRMQISSLCNPHSSQLEEVYQRITDKESILVRNDAKQLSWSIYHSDRVSGLLNLAEPYQDNYARYSNLLTRMIAALSSCQDFENAALDDPHLSALHKFQAPLRITLQAVFETNANMHLQRFHAIIRLISAAHNISIMQAQHSVLGDICCNAFIRELKLNNKSGRRPRLSQLKVTEESPLVKAYESFRPQIQHYCQLSDLNDCARPDTKDKITWKHNPEASQAIAKHPLFSRFFVQWEHKQHNDAFLLCMQAVNVERDV